MIERCKTFYMQHHAPNTGPTGTPACRERDPWPCHARLWSGVYTQSHTDVKPYRLKRTVRQLQHTAPGSRVDIELERARIYMWVAVPVAVWVPPPPRIKGPFSPKI
eukprot:6955352-Prymnesium_polylepis.1